MSSAICFNLDQSQIFSCNGLTKNESTFRLLQSQVGRCQSQYVILSPDVVFSSHVKDDCP